MNSYEVKVHKEYSITLMVDAENIEDAEEKASDLTIEISGGTPKDLRETESWVISARQVLDRLDVRRKEMAKLRGDDAYPETREQLLREQEDIYRGMV